MLMRGGVRSGSCELFAACKDVSMEHVGAGVAVRGAYNDEQRRGRERLAARLAAGESLEEPAAAAQVGMRVLAAEVDVPLDHENCSISKAAVPRLARRKRRLEATMAAE